MVFLEKIKIMAEKVYIIADMNISPLKTFSEKSAAIDYLTKNNCILRNWLIGDAPFFSKDDLNKQKGWLIEALHY